MNRVNKKDTSFKVTVDTNELKSILCCGRYTAVKIGQAAGARIQIGNRVLWSVAKVNAYLESIAE